MARRPEAAYARGSGHGEPSCIQEWADQAPQRQRETDRARSQSDNRTSLLVFEGFWAFMRPSRLVAIEQGAGWIRPFIVD